MVDTNKLLKQVYTVAFRLTGQEKTAGDLVLSALSLTDNINKWQQNPIPPHLIRSSTREVCRLFLHQPVPEQKQQLNPRPRGKQQNHKTILQAALLTLEPLQRVVVVWRDVAGLPLVDLVSMVKQPPEELYRILGQARRKLKQQLSNVPMH